MSIARELWEKWRRRWRMFWCTHQAWRPAETSRGPARWCEDCDLIEMISAEEMYAYFGVYPKMDSRGSR